MTTAERLVILADQREKILWQFSPNVALQRAFLETADYTAAGLTDRVCIERKSKEDFVSSCTHGRERLDDECRRMGAYDLFRAIILEGSIEEIRAHAYRSKAHPNSIIGSAVAFHVDYGVPVIWAGNAACAANMCERILTRLWKKHVQVTT